MKWTVVLLRENGQAEQPEKALNGFSLSGKED